VPCAGNGSGSGYQGIDRELLAHGMRKRLRGGSRPGHLYLSGTVEVHYSRGQLICFMSLIALLISYVWLIAHRGKCTMILWYSLLGTGQAIVFFWLYSFFCWQYEKHMSGLPEGFKTMSISRSRPSKRRGGYLYSHPLRPDPLGLLGSSAAQLTERSLRPKTSSSLPPEAPKQS
jgi:hypothetical protein